MVDHVAIGILLGLMSGILALLVIAGVTLRRFDSLRYTEGLRLHRTLFDLQRTLREEVAAVRQDVQAAVSVQARQADVAADRLAGLVDGAVNTLREHPLPALGALAEVQERRLTALAGELTRLAETLATDAAGHAKDLRDELLESLRATLDEFRAAHAVQVAQVRASVDEKLERTIEARLGDSFRLVSERLELVSDRLEHVHSGLGEVQTFAAGLGHLQRAVATVRLDGTKTSARGGETPSRPRAPRRKRATPEIPAAGESERTTASSAS